MRTVQTQELINDSSDIGKHYRYELMKSRDLYTSIQPFTAFTETPSFLKRSGRELHEYQVEGVNWLINAWFKKTNVILADEMGLGKTVQAVAFISYLMNVQQVTRPFLIAVPLSTLQNWVREFKTWCPEARVVVYTSNKQNSGNYESGRSMCR